jgi:glycosyltransferase involved in cell wall biosynthesis
MTNVSVVIPTRNRWPLLRRTLGSALAQAGVDVEVVVVDDASTDDTARELDAIDDPRLRVVRHDAQRRTAAARNSGIEAARGAWVAFLDDDDIWAPDKLAAQLAAAHSAGAQFAYCGAVGVDIDGEPRVLHPDPPSAAALREQIVRRNVIPAGASNVVASTELLREVGGFDERLFQLADWDLWIRLAAAASAASIPHRLVAITIHPGNQAAHERRDELRAEFAYIRHKHGEAPDAVWFHHWTADVLRSSGRRAAAASEYLRCAAMTRRPGHVVLAARVLAGNWAMDGRRRLPPGAAPDWLDSYRDRVSADASSAAS